MKLRQSVNIKQIMSLKQVLSPKIIHMLKTFNYSYDDLYKTIKEEQETNSFIEITQDDSLRSYAHSRSSSEDHVDFTEYTADTHQETLSEFLHQQLPFQNLNETDTRVAKILIDHIDNKGYLSDYEKVREKIMSQTGASQRKVFDMLKVIQSLEPDGVGARTVQECLKIQIEQYHFDNQQLQDILLTLVTKYFDDVSTKNYTALSEKLDIPEDGVDALLSFIRENLSPYPGSKFSDPTINKPIIPSFEVELDNNDIKLTNLEETKGLKFTISPQYEVMLKDPNLDHETKHYLKEKLEKAKLLAEAIEQRQENLEKLVSHIINVQDQFIRKGLLYLVPLQQNTLSETLQISPSTVSRILSSKFIITPHGTFSLKELCPRNHFGYTKTRLTHLIKDLCDSHPEDSDQKIMSRLHTLGIHIARRTVTKYRHLAQELDDKT